MNHAKKMISGSPMDSEKLISKEVIMNGMCIQFCGGKKVTMADGSSMLVTKIKDQGLNIKDQESKIKDFFP